MRPPGRGIEALFRLHNLFPRTTLIVGTIDHIEHGLSSKQIMRAGRSRAALPGLRNKGVDGERFITKTVRVAASGSGTFMLSRDDGSRAP